MTATPARRVLACLASLLLPATLIAAVPDDMQLFLLIGQSNMAGRGVVEEQDRTPHPRVYMLTKELTWAPAVDPLHFDKPDRIGTGLGKTFGQDIADIDPASTIGLVPAAFGGSALAEWAPGSPHFENAVRRTRAALRHGRLVGILWHQGEEDSAPENAATYPVRFAAFIAHLRATLDSQTVPVIVGETGRFRPDGTAINAALARVPEYVPHCAFVSSEGLTDGGDRIHFDAASFRELGHRYAAAWVALAQNPVPLRPLLVVPRADDPK